jgi:uncharacterized short protein YbdD (DUF466 family)
MAGMTSVLPAVRRAAGAVSWYVKGVMGDDAYDKYLRHFEGAHASSGRPDAPGAPRPMTAREFWRDRSDRQDANPQGRCC